MTGKVQVLKAGKVVAELSLDMFPLDVKMPTVHTNGVWSEKTYTWRITKRHDTDGNTDTDKPKGMQLQ